MGEGFHESEVKYFNGKKYRSTAWYRHEIEASRYANNLRAAVNRDTKIVPQKDDFGKEDGYTVFVESHRR